MKASNSTPSDEGEDRARLSLRGTPLHGGMKSAVLGCWGCQWEGAHHDCPLGTPCRSAKKQGIIMSKVSQRLWDPMQTQTVMSWIAFLWLHV